MDQTNEQLEAEVQALVVERTRLGLEMTRHQNEMATIKNAIRSSGRYGLPASKYRQLCSEQTSRQKAMADLLEQINTIKARLANIHLAKVTAPRVVKFTSEEGSEENVATSKPDTVRALAVLRDDYQKFAADKSRVASMRQMAAEFVLKLNPIIKDALRPNA